MVLCCVIFFFQAEDGIRDGHVMEFRRVLFRSTWPASLIAMAKLTRPPGSVPRFRGGGGGGLSKSEARYGPVVSLLKPICESLMYRVKSTTYGPSIPFSLIAIPLKRSRTE